MGEVWIEISHPELLSLLYFNDSMRDLPLRGGRFGHWILNLHPILVLEGGRPRRRRTDVHRRRRTVHVGVSSLVFPQLSPSCSSCPMHPCPTWKLGTITSCQLHQLEIVEIELAVDRAKLELVVQRTVPLQA